jgi:N-acetylneuraminic acid mutarotase
MKYERLFGTGALTGSGKLLVAGGKKADVAPYAHTELFNPTSNDWSTTEDLSQPRTGAEAVTLESGRVLHIAGYNQFDQTTVAVVDVFDEATGSWSEIGSLAKKRSSFSATRLGDGRVLVCGGFSTGLPLKECELSVSE